MKASLIIIGMAVVVIAAVFCYLIIAGADESRRRSNKTPKGKNGNEKNINGM